MAPHGKTKTNAGLRTLVQRRLLDDVFQTSCDKWPGWMVLIVDQLALRVISSVVGMYDLMERRVTLVEDLTKKRAPFKEMASIYLLSATDDSVNRMIADYTPTETRTEPLYGSAAFIYFMGKLPDHLLNRIKACRPLLKRIKALGEVNVDFLAKEMRAFHFDMRSSFKELFLREATTNAELIIADKLVTVCATLNEYPHIRFRAKSPLCVSLANVFHMKMNEFVGGNVGWWYHGDSNHTDRERATLLLLDRSDDCLSPFMHEFTYQAMVNDLLPVDEDRITYQSETIGSNDTDPTKPKTMEKDVLLNENDELWVELSDKHIADVIQTLSSRIRDIVNSNTASVAKGKSNESTKALTLTQMAAALRELPEYQEVMSKLSQHMHLSNQCMEIFNRRGLLDLSDLEQTLATGKTDEGFVPKLSSLVNQVEEELSGQQDPITRIRLLAIFIVSQRGIRQIDKDRLFAAARLSAEDVRTLNNLGKLGVPLLATRTSNKITSMFTSQKLSSSGRVDSESEYASSRYVCALKGILEDVNANKLSIEEYPSVLPLPDDGAGSGGHHAGTAVSARTKPAGSARKGGKASRWAKTGGQAAKKSHKPGADANFTGGRRIVFVAGGMCYSELRAVHEVLKKGEREFVAGSTCFVNPTEFVEDLASLG